MTTQCTAARARTLDWINEGPKPLLIDGRWIDAASGKNFETINQAAEELLCHVAEADKADVDAAVLAARKAFEAPSWTRISPHARTRALQRIADKIEQHADELAAIESLDKGMPLWFARGAAAATVAIEANTQTKSVMVRM